MIPLSVVYDQFYWGFREPNAIRNFLKYTQDNWDPSPKYILLIGDATYDMRGYQSTVDRNQLPTFQVFTEFGGETASDFGYMGLTGMNWPDEENAKIIHDPQIIVGRIPAQTSSQLSQVIQKILNYEEQISEKNHRGQVLLVADDQDTNFQEDAKAFSDNLLDQYEFYFPQSNIIPPGLELKELWGKDYSYIVYFGHGSINQWGKGRIISTEDINNLPDQVMPPIVIQMTCLTGLFTHPTKPSLSEELILLPSGGSIALLAPTSLTLPQEQRYLSNAIANEISNGNHMRLGDLLLASWKKFFLDIPGSNDVYQTFILLGDPALSLP